jgi:3-hydroxybutyryl-CoA dehydrogenase
MATRGEAMKVFIIGEESIKNEAVSLLDGKSEITNKLNLDTEIVIECTNFPAEQKQQNIKFIDENCTAAIPVFSSSLCISVSEQCSYTKYPTRLIGAGFYDTFSKSLPAGPPAKRAGASAQAGKLLEIAPSKITDVKIVQNAESFLNSAGINFAKVPDRVGLVFPRIISMIINEAAQAYSEQVASKEDIDTAMKLGTNYPFGPLEWADKLGIGLVYEILSALQRDFGEDRYRPHPVLKEMIDLKHLGVKTKRGFYEY